MRILCLLIIATILVLPGAAKASDWIIDAENSAITFSLSAYGNEETGGFDAFTADITFDPEDLTSAQISAIVDLSGISISNGQYESAMRGTSGLDISQFPQAQFVSDRIEARDNGYTAFGALTLKGQSHPAELEFTLDIVGDQASAEGSFSISRSPYAIGASSWSSVSEAVDVRVSITARRAP